MRPETKNQPPEEIVDEDTVDTDDEDQRDTMEEIDPALLKAIKEQQHDTALGTKKTAQPSSSTIWVKHPWHVPKPQ